MVIFKIWNCQGTVTNNLDAIDATDAKNVVKNVDVTDAKNVIKDVDATNVKNVVKDVDATDVTSGKYSLLGEMTDADGKEYQKFLKEGPQEGLTQAEIIGIYKADKQTALNTKSKKVVSGKSIEGGKKAISYTDYDNIYQSSIHNAGKDKVMLGKYDGGGATSYITKAGSDYEYFSLGNNWNTIKSTYGFTDDEMFKLFNEAFLDDGINAGKTFQFSHNPIGDQGTLGEEYMYLLQNNYVWDDTTMTMIPKY